MTPAEKAGQLTQYFYFRLPAGAEPDPLLGLDVDGRPGWSSRQCVKAARVRCCSSPIRRETNRLQRLAVEDSRLGIPLLFGFDVIHGLRTIFPVPIAMAASWDPETIERGQSVAAREARAVGIHWTFAPMVDIARDPRWGRIIEGAGEDPYLGAAVAAAQVRGFQGGELGAAEHIIAGPKHFAGYGAALGGRDYDEVNLSDSELWNVYLPPFKAAVEAGAGNVMTAYMELNGIPATGNRWLFTEVLRETWGFEGFVVSDANAVRSLLTHGFAERPGRRRCPRASTPASTWRWRSPTPRTATCPTALESGAATRADGRRKRPARAGSEDPDGTVRCAVRRRGPRARSARRPGTPRRGACRRRAVGSAAPQRGRPACRSTPAAWASIAVIGPLADSKRDTLGPWSLRLRPGRDGDRARGHPRARR